MKGKLVFLLAGAVVTAGLMPESPASAQTATALLARAIANTNAARTYVEQDSVRQDIGPVHMVTSSRELYDEAHNSEHDHMTMTASRTANGHTQTKTYVIEVIMVNGHTYHRSSSDGKWAVQSGLGYKDPVTGNRWIRSSLRFTFLRGLRVAKVSVGAPGMLGIQFAIPKSSGAYQSASIRAVVTTGHTPYVVRYVEAARYTSHGQRFSSWTQSVLQDFNRPVKITAPTTTM